MPIGSQAWDFRSTFHPNFLIIIKNPIHLALLCQNETASAENFFAAYDRIGADEYAPPNIK